MTGPGRDARRFTGFTFIETIAAVLIICILVALAATAFRIALDRANQIKCLSQLRQIGGAFHLYAVENNGCGPYDARDQGNDSLEVTQYNGKPVLFGPLVDYISSNINDVRHLVICPASSSFNTRFQWQNGERVSYWMNPEVSVNSANMRPLVIIDSRTACIIDSCAWWDPSAPSVGTPNHQGRGLNVYRLDGSAAWIDINRTRGTKQWRWLTLNGL